MICICRILLHEQTSAGVLVKQDPVTSLDKHRYIIPAIRRSSLSSGLKLSSLPPTTAAGKFHSYRANLAAQQSPTDWDWQYRDGNRDGILVPVDADWPVAPTRVLRIVSCGCKTGCQKTRGCRNAGLHCSTMCSHCNGQTCGNTRALPAGPDSDSDT